MTTASAKNYALLCLLSCGAILLCAGCRKAPEGKAKKVDFEIDRPYERGPLTAHVRVDKAKITIAETLLLELQAAVEPGYDVTMPRVDQVLKDFGIVDWENLGDRLDDKNNRLRTYRYRLEPFLSGKYQIPALAFDLHDANDPNTTSELLTEPIDVEVTSLLGADREKLVIADIEDVVEVPAKPSLWWLWLLAAAAAAAALATWLYLRRKKVRELVRIFRPAHEIAYARLRALVAEDLLAAGKLKEFYERISDILRHYIEHRFDLRAPERTTEEFLAELQHTDALPGPEKEHLEEFLTHCDLVKFARHSPTAEQIQRTFDLLRDFIEKTKSDESKIDVTDRIDTGQNVEAGIV